MRYIKITTAIFILIFVLCGCKRISPADNPVAIKGKTIALEEINAGIKEAFNCHLFYYGTDTPSNVFPSTDMILGKDLEYDLYFEQNPKNDSDPFHNPHRFHIVITNLKICLPHEDHIQFYNYAVELTNRGMRSDFYSMSRGSQSFEEDFVFLGHYTMRINEIQKPKFETMDDEWKEKAAQAIRLYMEKNNFYAEKSLNLNPGNYCVYIQKFFESDENSYIFFEHENGSIYRGCYYFVHEITSNTPADLNNVELYPLQESESFKKYFSVVQENPALCVEYSVKLNTGD